MLAEVLNVVAILLGLGLSLGGLVLMIRATSQPDKEVADRLWKRNEALFCTLGSLIAICTFLARYLEG